MAYGFGSLLNFANSGRRMIGLYIWILVISSSYAEKASRDITRTSKDVQKDLDQKGRSSNTDSDMFVHNEGHDLHLSTSFLTRSLPLGSTTKALSLGAHLDLTPSFGFLEEDAPSKRTEKDINSNNISPETTKITFSDTEEFQQSNSGNADQKNLVQQEKRLVLEKTSIEIFTPAAYSGVLDNITGTSSQNDIDTVTNKLKSPADNTSEIYFPRDSVPFVLTALQEEYSALPTVLDNISSQTDFVFNASGASPSETSRVVAFVLPETSSSERYFPMDNLLTATSDISSLDPPIQHRSIFVNISSFGVSSSSLTVNGSMINVGPSLDLPLENSPTNSAFIFSDTGKIMPTKTLDQDLSAIYNFSEKATGSSVDVPLESDFSRNFESTTLSSIVPQQFSDVTILPSADHSHSTPNISAGYLPIISTGWKTSVNEIISEWEPASLQPEPPHDANRSTLLHQSRSLVASPVILHTASSSATGLYFQPQHVDTKEWAVPVIVGLSLALLMAVVATVLTCRRLKTGHDGPRYFGGEAGTEVNDIGNKQRETENTTVHSVPEVHPRYKQPMHENVLDSPRDDRNPNVGQRDVAKGRKCVTTKSSPAPGAIAGRQTFEMDHMFPADRAHVCSQQNTQSNQEEYYRRNEEMYYDDHSFIHGSPNSRHGFSERIQNSPKSGNRVVSYKEGKAYTLNKTPQTEFETSQVSSQMSQHKPKIKTRNITGSENYTPITDSSDSRFSYSLTAHDRQDLAGTKHVGYNSSKDGYVSDEYRGDHCWESWDDRRYAKGEHCSARDNRSINGEDADSIEGYYSDIRESHHVRTDHRPMMYKCVSFDESRGRATDDPYNCVSSDKSPTRKISTMSESAMTYLSVPREGFIPMSSAYETVDDLSEVGHPSSSSHFFIGSDSSHINNVSREKNVSVEDLEISARKRSIDSIEETTGSGSSNNAEAKNVKVNLVSDKEQRQTKDDYIFPIVRKANLKIMKERRNKNPTCGNSSSDENETVATDRLWTRQKARASDIQNREPEMTVNEAMGSASAASSASPSRRISHTSYIPTIVLTKEEDETTAESERQNNLPHPAEVKPPRVRRLARANNPFLIEVDSPAVSEKVRRSSAPSMTRRLIPGAGSRQGMVRSASNDHLTHHNFNHLDSYPRRPWSSEFFDLVVNSDGYTKDERFKKLIDDRYDALFNNKHPYPMVMSSSVGQNFQQGVSPRIYTLLASDSHTSLPRGGQGDVGCSRNRDIGDTEIIPKLSPILDSIKSEEMHLLRGENDCLSPDSRPTTQYLEVQLEIPRSNITFSDTQPSFQRNRNVTYTTAEHETVKARLVYIRDSQSPRPSLAPGTDGIDNDIDLQERTTLANLSGNRDHHNESSMQTEASHPSECNNNTLTHSKTYWESFDDDLEVERLTVASKPVSDEAFTLDNSNCPTNLAEGGSELSSEETANKTTRRRVKGIQRHRFTEAAGADSTELSVGDLDSVKEPVHDQSNGTFSERNPTLDSQTSISREISRPNHNNPETFEDNFSVNTVNFTQPTQERALTISDSQTFNDVLHKADQESQQEQATQTGPQIPPRRARRRAPKVPRQARPPSPFTNRTDSQSKTFQTRKYSLENDTNTQVMTDNKNTEWDDKYHLRQSLLNEGNDRSETSSIASLLDRAQQRSYSVGENTGASRTRPQRATSVETDQPSAHLTYFNKWSQFFNEMEPRFLSSANNTVLQHDISHDSVSLSDPELEEYFESTVSPASIPSQKNEQNRLKALLLDDNEDAGAKISRV